MGHLERVGPEKRAAEVDKVGLLEVWAAAAAKVLKVAGSLAAVATREVRAVQAEQMGRSILTPGAKSKPAHSP
jgi:hypothetical protein